MFSCTEPPPKIEDSCIHHRNVRMGAQESCNCLSLTSCSVFHTSILTSHNLQWITTENNKTYPLSSEVNICEQL